MSRVLPRTAADPTALLQDALSALASNPREGVTLARSAVRQFPDLPMAHRVLARALRAQDNVAEAEQVELKAIEVGLRHPAMIAAEAALKNDRLEDAESAVRPYLRENPEDAGGALILAAIAERCGAAKEAENLTRRAILLAPAYVQARVALAKLLNGTGRHEEALAVLDEALQRDPKHLVALSLTAGMLVQYRRLDQAETLYKRLLRAHPGDGRGWVNYAHLLKTTGRTAESIDAFRSAVKAEPGYGTAWWGLANLKSVKLDAADADVMRRAIAAAADDEDRIHLHFALGKALGDQRHYRESFEHYQEGSRIRLAGAPHDPDAVHANVRKAEAVFTPEFLKARAGQGSTARDPIFIVSMPRSGSTLIEQILASHPMIEGTEELYDLERIALELAPNAPAGGYLDVLPGLNAAQLRQLGERYVADTRRHRKTGRPYFTDKMPSNWIFSGFIKTILPNAKIVDVRRHPMACGFANFAQHYNWGINFSYDLTHIGRFYADYVEMMDHFDRVAPGMVHRVIHEELVDDLEGEVRRLLDYLELPFDAACLNFHQTERAVHTPSSEQVREPVNKKGFGTWRNYEPWLGPLEDALGPVLDSYPHAPGK